VNARQRVGRPRPVSDRSVLLGPRRPQAVELLSEAREAAVAVPLTARHSVAVVARAEIHHQHRSVTGGAARAAVFGVSDGLVSNVSLILGFAGGGAGSGIVRLAGLAGAIAGGISMAAGEWISVSAQNELIEREVAIERRELSVNADAETAELAAMYVADGMSRDDAERAASDVMREPELALVVHARAELGIDPRKLASPLQAALSSMVAFLVGALLPVIPWLVGAEGGWPTAASVAIGVVAAAIVGSFIGRLAARSVLRSALRQVLIVLVACGVTSLIGQLVGVSV
jgi:VIT1/CCC1 family predicted Fe2+/Mn2+ transporter